MRYFRQMSCNIRCGDCLDLMKSVPDKSVQLILCDLPYGTTSCDWDILIDIEPLWEQYRRIISPTGAIVLTAAQPFTSVLTIHGFDWFRYSLVWLKNRSTNFVHAKNRPMSKHEDILVFSPASTGHATKSKNRMTYNPQNLVPIPTKRVTKRDSERTNAFFPYRPGHREFERSFTNYPNTVLEFDTDQLGLHPTAKPIDLMRYLIRTYSNLGETVMDNAMGSGTTGVAALLEDRAFIGFELQQDFYDIAESRLLLKSKAAGAM